jgi:hypothetical protein
MMARFAASFTPLVRFLFRYRSSPRRAETASSEVAALIVKQKADPAPGSDSTQIVPPDSSMIFLQIARPKPAPGVSGPCRRFNGRKTCSWCSGAMPIPLSLTFMIQSGPSHSAREAIRSGDHG